jgi:hypothetical protein
VPYHPCLSKSSTRGTQQNQFHCQVLARDSSVCVFCWCEYATAFLEAAHIFEVFDVNDIDGSDTGFLWNKYQILTEYSVENGFTLCVECHRVFDALLCYVDIISMRLRMHQQGIN